MFFMAVSKFDLRKLRHLSTRSIFPPCSFFPNKAIKTCYGHFRPLYIGLYIFSECPITKTEKALLVSPVSTVCVFVLSVQAGGVE